MYKYIYFFLPVYPRKFSLITRAQELWVIPLLVRIHAWATMFNTFTSQKTKEISKPFYSCLARLQCKCLETFMSALIKCLGVFGLYVNLDAPGVLCPYSKINANGSLVDAYLITGSLPVLFWPGTFIAASLCPPCWQKSIKNKWIMVPKNDFKKGPSSSKNQKSN